MREELVMTNHSQALSPQWKQNTASFMDALELTLPTFMGPDQIGISSQQYLSLSTLRLMWIHSGISNDDIYKGGKYARNILQCTE